MRVSLECPKRSLHRWIIYTCTVQLSETREGSCHSPTSYTESTVPWRLRHPPVGHCDTPTRTIWHCNDSPHKRFHIETIRPHRGWTVQPHPNRSVQPLRSGSKRWLWQSDPFSASPGGLGDSSGDDTQIPLLKTALRHPNFTHAWVSWAQAWPNLTPNMERPTQQNST